MLGTKQVWGGQPGAGGTWVSHLGVLGFRQDCAPKAHPSAVPQERQNIIRYWLENLRAKQGEALHNIHFLEGQPISEYGTARHSMAQHSTARHSMAQPHCPAPPAHPPPCIPAVPWQHIPLSPGGPYPCWCPHSCSTRG